MSQENSGIEYGSLVVIMEVVGSWNSISGEIYVFRTFHAIFKHVERKNFD